MSGDGFYEWLLSDAPAAVRERARRRAANAARSGRECDEVAVWCERTLANTAAPEHLRDLAMRARGLLARRTAREACDEAVPDELWVQWAREAYERARRVAGEFEYSYPVRYLGAAAARQPVPDEGSGRLSARAEEPARREREQDGREPGLGR